MLDTVLGVPDAMRFAKAATHTSAAAALTARSSVITRVVGVLPLTAPLPTFGSVAGSACRPDTSAIHQQMASEPGEPSGLVIETTHEVSPAVVPFDTTRSCGTGVKDSSAPLTLKPDGKCAIQPRPRLSLPTEVASTATSSWLALVAVGSVIVTELALADPVEPELTWTMFDALSVMQLLM